MPFRSKVIFRQELDIDIGEAGEEFLYDTLK